MHKGDYLLALMKSLSKIIDQLEVKYFKVSRKLSDLSKKNKMLTEALASSDIKLKDAQNRILSLESEIDKLRTANSLLGSGKNKKCRRTTCAVPAAH